MRGDNSLKNTEFSQLVEKARKGDADAFAQLYSLVYKDLYRIALANLNNNQHDASDVVSDTVLDAYSSIKKLKDESAFKAWITKILTAKIKKKQKEYIERNSYRKELEDIESVEQGKSGEIHENGFEIMEEFKKLGEEERLVLSLSIISGYSSDEIARMTGISANTVRSKVARAKIKLKAMLTDQ